MADAIINFVRSMAPEKLVQDIGSDGFVKAGFESLSLALSSLDTEKNTAAIVLLLAAQAKIIEKTKDPIRMVTYTEEFGNRTTALLAQLDTRQLSLVVADLKLATQAYTDIMIRKKAIAGIKPLRTLIRRYSPGASFITPQHAMFVQLCLSAGAYTAALPIIADHPFELNVEKTGVDGKDVRLYLYYAGMAWIGIGKWDEAIEVLRACVQVPAQGCSAIVLEAYKKFVLASLIHLGSAEQLSKHFIPSIQRHNKQYVLYDDLAATYATQSLDALFKLIAQNKETLSRDRNYGLAKQLFPALQRRIVHSLTKTFLTLSLADIGSRIMTESTSETEAFIADCIKRGDITASISQKDGMVSFEGSSTSNSNATRAELDERLRQFLRLHQTLENADFAMATDPKYIEKCIGVDKAGAIANARAGMAMDEDDAVQMMRG